MFEKPQDGAVSYDSEGKVYEANKKVDEEKVKEEIEKQEAVQNNEESSEVESDETKIEQVRKNLRDSASEKVLCLRY